MRRVVQLCALIGLLSPLCACSSTDPEERRARATAQRYAKAIENGDSVALAQLSPSGRAHNGLCAARLWPDALTGRNRGPLEVRRLRSAPDDSVWEFRAYGARTLDRPALPAGMVAPTFRSVADSQAHASAQRAAFDVVVLKRDPSHVLFFAIAQADSFNWEPFRTCIDW